MGVPLRRVRAACRRGSRSAWPIGGSNSSHPPISIRRPQKRFKRASTPSTKAAGRPDLEMQWMVASSARVATERPTGYLRQLCEHFAHERGRHSAPGVEVTFDDHEGFVDFAPIISGTCRLDARQEGVLALEARGSDQAALERVQRLLTEHVERFGRPDGLTVEWGPSRSSPRRVE